MFLYAWMMQLVWPIFVIVLEVSSIEGSAEDIQRKLFELPSRRGPRSAYVQDNVGDQGSNSFHSMEMDSYQGLVGRPGIDFPVLTHIPKTVFDCKNHGNGYFADLETRCQVFHICDDKKKISFLCPNGTIFRQLDLICDWWFKVDCSATPNHFAESTEMLTQAKRARLQSKHPVPQPINQSDERLTVSIQDKRLLLGSTNHFRQQSVASEDRVRDALEFNRRIGRSGSAESSGDENDSFNNRRNVNINNKADKISFATDEIQDTAQSASFASIAKKMFNTYYAQDQLFKDQATANKLRRTEANVEGSHRDYLSALQFSKDARVENSSSSSNKNVMNYMPYTTARKLNLNSKVTQFYTPTVPTFTTSTRTPTVGTVTEDAMVTTKATTINGFSNSGVGGTAEPQTFGDQFTHSIRREGTADEESIMDHAMEIMQTIKNLNIDESANHRNSAKETIDEMIVSTSTIPDGQRNTFTQFGPSVKESFDFLLHPSGTAENVDRFRRMRIVSERNSNVDVGHRSLLTRTTLNEYDRLFQSKNNENRIDDDRGHDMSEAELYADSQMEHDLEGQSSKYPIFGMSNSTQIRELAQIFTHALSAYLQDPVTFRRILTEIRPKAPGMQPPASSKSIIMMDRSEIGEIGSNFPSSSESTTHSSVINSIQYERLKGSENFEELDYSDITTTTVIPNPTTDVESSQVDTSTIPTTKVEINTEFKNSMTKAGNTSRKQGKSLSIKFITNSRNELADEVNSELGVPSSLNHILSLSNRSGLNDKSNRTQIMSMGIPNDIINQMASNAPSISPALPTAMGHVATETISVPQSILKPPVITNNRYFLEPRPKTTVLLEDEEQLQRAQSESFLTNQNNHPIYERNKYSVISLHNFKENSVTGETFGSVNKTPIAAVYPSGSVPQEATGGVPSSRTTMSYTVFFDPLTINDELMEVEKPTPTIAHSPAIYTSRQYGWNGTLLNKDLVLSETPKEILSTQPQTENLREDASMMQTKANQMFGDLNDAQADKLMTAIKMADKDKSMRRLILLLIRTCDDDPTSTNEESRKALLEALIKIGGVVDSQRADGLRVLSDNQHYDSSLRRGKEIRLGGATNVLQDESSDLLISQNMTATTENYVNVLRGSNDGTNIGESGSQDDSTNSEEWSKGGETTAATTKMYYSSGESYLPTTATDRLTYGYDETISPQSTTTPFPSTIFQTTADSSSTVLTTVTEPTVITTVAVSATSEASDYGSSTTIQTTPADFADTNYRSRESLESSEMKPTFIISQRFPKDLSKSIANPSSNRNKRISPHNSDTRALELLKSLYSLAARWG